MGAVFRCPVWTCGLEELRALLTKSGLPLYGAALRSDTVDVRRADFSHCAVAVGSEGKGLSADALAACDLTVRIDQSGQRCLSSTGGTGQYNTFPVADGEVYIPYPLLAARILKGHIPQTYHMRTPPTARNTAVAAVQTPNQI